MEKETTGFLFPRGLRVRHLKSGGIYTILETPDVLRIEDGNRPAYAYTDGKIQWVRPQSEMEDGRFAVLPPGDAD